MKLWFIGFRRAIRKLFIRSVALGLIVCGCSDSILDRSRRLREGMTVGDVKSLFADCDEFFARTNITLSNSAILTKTFQTNRICSEIMYLPKHRIITHSAPGCSIYFDERGYIVGYRYSRPD